MARIRSIKPDFFRNEELQDLEASNPGEKVMLVFAGLWGHCDNQGRFEWKPRTLKLDILPFLDFDLSKTLELLSSAGLIRKYTVGGKVYGFIHTFTKHQRITGKEAHDGSKFPDPPKENKPENNGETTGKQSGNTWDTPSCPGREGKGIGREEEGREMFPGETVSALSLSTHGKSEDFKVAWERWKKKQQAKTGRPMDQATEECQLMDLHRFETSEAIAIVEFSTGRTDCKNLIFNGDHKRARDPTPSGSHNGHKKTKAEQLDDILKGLVKT